MNERENFTEICNIATTELGIEKGSLSRKSRKIDLCILRMVVSNIAMIEEHINKRIIGEILNRDRTSIFYYEKTHQGNYANWKPYRDAFNKVYSKYIDIQNRKSKFKSLLHFKEYLNANGIINKKPEQIKIKITSIEFDIIIKTSYMEFSKTLENIKLSLKNYNYQCKIL